MKEVTSNHYGGNSTNLVMKDENGGIVAVFEDKSSVLGNKIAVYDQDGNGIYFLDEDLSRSSTSFLVQKDADIVANVKRVDNIAHRPIKVEAKGHKYNFGFMNRILQKDGNKIAKLIINDNDHNFVIELYELDDEIFTVVLMYTIYMVIIG